MPLFTIHDLAVSFANPGGARIQAVDGVSLTLVDVTDDRFRGRVIFPIRDTQGRTIAFGGRIIAASPDSDAPKYLNSSDSPIYTKGEHLYGLCQARGALARERRALLTEGYVDVLALHQHGFPTAVGVLGTALTDMQVRRLGQLVSQVDLVFDGDSAGRKAALKSAPMVLAQGLKCRVALLPEGLDADDLLRQEGRLAFQAVLDAAPEGLEFCLAGLREQAPKDVLEFVRNFMRSLKDAALAAYYLPRLAAGLGMDEAKMVHMIAYGRDMVDEILFDHKELTNAVLDEAQRRATAHGIRLTIPDRFDLSGRAALEPQAALHKKCPRPWEEVFVQSDGKVRLCMLSKDIMGDLAVEGVEDIWNNEKFQAVRATINTPRAMSTCAKCPQYKEMNVNDRAAFIQVVSGCRSTKLTRTMDLAPLKPYFQGTTRRSGAPFCLGIASPYMPTARSVRGCMASSRRRASR